MTKKDIDDFVCTKCHQPVALCYIGRGSYLGVCRGCSLTFRADPETYVFEIIKITFK